MKNTMQKWVGLMGSKLGTPVLIASSFLLILSGCHPLQQSEFDRIDPYEKNFEIIGSEKDELMGKVNPAIFTTVDRSNAGVEQVESPVYTKEGVEVSLRSGRYSISGYPAGNIFIFDEIGDLITREIVSYSGGVSTLTVDIEDSYTVFADGGFDHVTFTPVATQLSTDLTAGIWEVGLDIESGKYTITAPWGLGYLEIHEQGEDPILYEIVGGNPIGSESLVELTEGQQLRIKEIALVQFTRVEE